MVDGVNAAKPNRQARRAAEATATAKPAIDASIERAAIERNPAGAPDLAAIASAADTTIVAPAADARVVPEPTLVAEPGAPKPIVTASPILAVELDALDVANEQTKSDRVAAGMESAADADAPHGAAAGQPTLTIDRHAVPEVLRDAIADGALVGSSRAATLSIGSARRDVLGNDASDDLGRQMDSGRQVMTLDEILHNLDLLSHSDPIGMDIIRTRFFADAERRDRDDASLRLFAPRASSSASLVTVIEVVGPPQGRRRAGRSFGPKAVRFLASQLDADAVAALRADPLLTVGVSEVEADAFGYPVGGLD